MRDERNQSRRSPWLLLGAAALFLLSKGKTVLLALSKFSGPLISMGITVGAYALFSPIWFAVGLVLLILVHEIGHVLAAKRKGLPVSLPLFIPFIGALIMMKKHPKDAVTEAYIAMGGPVVGTVGALVVYIAGYALDNPFLLVLANVGFLINLFNLIPIHPLDGGRISTAVSRWLWLVGLIGGAAVIIYLKSWLLFLIWALFAWDLYQKYVKYRGTGKPQQLQGVYEVDLYRLQSELPSWYAYSDQHLGPLAFTTYCRLSGEQIVRFNWGVLNFQGELEVPSGSIIRAVELTGNERVMKEDRELLRVTIRVDYAQTVDDRYYEVPKATRWRYGAAYAGLALFLVAMIWSIQAMGLPKPY
ncbi:site-2 protease family protein [Paenibacillus sp. 1P07SE]|uniref:site-2 protease family protein n=1 Tax=Paenibacillus sp. 1P07SE TaxID=3132209 RepID=UPI0039A402BD